MAKRRPPARKKPTAEAAEKAAAKKARRAERQRLEAEARAKAARKAKLRKAALAAAGGAVVVLAAFFVFSLLQPGTEVAGVEKPPNQGRDHLLAGQTWNYPTATPTSGTHAPNAPATCGMIPGGLPLEFAVHALEHGVVVVWYRPDLAADLEPQLTTMIAEWDSHVIAAPNPGISEPLVATAWNRLKRFDEFSPEVAEFVDAYRRRGPENLPCDI